MNFLDRLKINPVFRTIYYFPSRKKYKKGNKIKEREKELRLNGYNDERFLRLKSMKNKHLGERCFIVATGPSLTLSDLDLIKNDISFSMNSIIKLFSKTTWRPTYYGIQDRFVWGKLKEDILKIYPEHSNVFIQDLFLDDEIRNKDYICFPFNSEYHSFETHYRKYFCKFSDDAYGIVYDGYSITYSLIQIAIYLGFKEIYLLGCDCHYNGDKNDHVNSSCVVDKYGFLNYKRMVSGYEEVKKYAEKNNIKVFNCTRGGKLEVFERISLDELFSKKGVQNGT